MLAQLGFSDMIITRKIKTPCPSCGNTGQYGNVSVSVNNLIRACNSCNRRETVHLPSLNKRILYLDQFFLSHAFRDNKKEFVTATERIVFLSKKQLIACPWSWIHDLETHQWRHSHKEKLWTFIKQISSGHRFSDPASIKSIQIQKAFDSFIKSEERKDLIEERDALDSDIHTWDNYLYVEVGNIRSDTELIRTEKKECVDALIQLFDKWKANNKSLEQDRIDEANGYAQVFIELYANSLAAIARGDIDGYLNSSADGDIFQLLLMRDTNTLSIQDRFSRVYNFFASEKFRSIPFVDLSSLIYAILRSRIRAGEYTNRNKARSRLSGLFYDIQAISIYGPYSYAMFIDKPMHEWLKKYEDYLTTHYSFRIFSASNWSAFHEFLDEIEANCPEDVENAIDIVYPSENLTPTPR